MIDHLVPMLRKTVGRRSHLDAGDSFIARQFEPGVWVARITGIPGQIPHTFTGRENVSRMAWSAPAAWTPTAFCNRLDDLTTAPRHE
jgi:hypothetical protein